MSEPDEHGGALWRGVIGLVLVGAALGLGHNWMQLAAGPHRGLAWIKQEAKLVSLESIAEAATPDAGAVDSAADAAKVATSTATAAAKVATSTATAASRAKAARDSSRTTPRAKKARAKAAARAATPKGAAATASRAATTPAATPAPAVAPEPVAAQAAPTVPNTREPLEAQYASIKKLWDAGVATFVDARSADEYAAGHIPGAVNMPFDDVFKNPDKAKTLQTRGRPVIVTYCGGGECDLSRNLAFSLIEAGHKKVLVFMGGLPGWKEAGNTVVTGTGPGTAP